MENLKEVLKYIDPARCSYQEWINVGMALKHEGYSCDIWDNWSALDGSRYHSGECESKWNTFNEQTESIVTGGTIVKMALDRGFSSGRDDYGLEWDAVINKDNYVVVDEGWIEGIDIEEPSDETWHPSKELISYLETLFDPDDIVGYVTKTWEKEGRYLPTKGVFNRTVRQVIEDLVRYGDDIAYSIGDYNKEAGAWIRFNPLDGKGVANENIKEYRYALVESDHTELSKQNAILRKLELPIACLVYSGKKSLHAIVKIDASTYQEYQKRVEYLYKICEKNGLGIDKANKNPSRLSRMPGVFRNGHKQFLLGTNIGKETWNDWFEWF